MLWVIAIIVTLFLIGVATDIYNRTPAGIAATKAAETKKAAVAAYEAYWSDEGYKERNLMMERARETLPAEFKKKKEAEKHVQMLRDGAWPHPD